MKRYFVWCLVLVSCVSCSLFSGLRKRTFTYNDGTSTQTLQLLVPKRYTKQEAGMDSAGNQRQVYHYSNGALLYVVHTTDTLAQFQPIDTANHIPKPHPFGGLMYKGLDSTDLFWREIRTDSFRFGYRFVPPDAEYYFDSSLNYAGMRRFKN